jgi:hypothetical protein
MEPDEDRLFDHLADPALDVVLAALADQLPPADDDEVCSSRFDRIHRIATFDATATASAATALEALRGAMSSLAPGSSPTVDSHETCE